jgi:hypothetical protein
LLLLGSAKGGRFRFSSRCAFLAQRDALGVHASLGAEPSALRLALGSEAGATVGVLDVCFWGLVGVIEKDARLRLRCARVGAGILINLSN